MSVHDRMRGVRQRGTALELEVRRLLRGAGIRYRTCPARLPGRPDLAHLDHRWALFVHGCFWHGHQACTLASIPKTNSAFWRSKFAANRRRDARKIRELEEIGFRVFVLWQCEIRDGRRQRRLVAALLRRQRNAG